MSLDAIELRHLRFYVALAEELSFSRGAARCNVSQPPFSVAIQQLEAYLQVSLVSRSSRRIQLTRAGEAFYEHAKRVLAQAQEAYAVSQRVSAGKKGRIRVGFHASMLFRGLGEAVTAIERDEPLLEVELIEMSSYDQVRALLTGGLDLGFAHTMITPGELASLTIYAEPLVACLPPDHPLAREASVDLIHLRGDPFIIFSRGASPAYFDRIVGLCVEAGFTPSIRHQVKQWLTVVSIVSRGLGVSIVPACLSRCGIGAAFLPLTEAAAVSSIQCMWLPGEDSPVLSRMMAYARQHIGSRSPHEVSCPI